PGADGRTGGIGAARAVRGELGVERREQSSSRGSRRGEDDALGLDSAECVAIVLRAERLRLARLDPGPFEPLDEPVGERLDAVSEREGGWPLGGLGAPGGAPEA